MVWVDPMESQGSSRVEEGGNGVRGSVRMMQHETDSTSACWLLKMEKEGLEPKNKSCL